jgi:hypothetical protein
VDEPTMRIWSRAANAGLAIKAKTLAVIKMRFIV